MRRSVLAVAGVVALTAATGLAGAGMAAAEPSTPSATIKPAPTSKPAQPAPAPSESSAPSTTASAQALAKIAWTRCGGVQCGTLAVPLDYTDPAKGTTIVNIARRPADDPRRRLGVLFVNPGGPGGSATSAVPAFAQIVGREVRGRFDIVGVDPRGVSGEDMAVCEAPGSDSDPEPPSVSFPRSNAERKAWFAYDAFKRKLCATSKPRILSYMTTADVARDMDQVRAALGAKTLNFYGVSYGSYLGATYAALFPQRVRTMVVDGVIDPVAWANGRGGQGRTTPISTRVGSFRGAQEALMAAFAECEAVGPQECGQAETIRNDWNALTTKLKKGPIAIGDSEFQIELTYQDFIALINGMLYNGEGVPDLVQFISVLNSEAEAGVKPAPGAPTARATTSGAPSGQPAQTTSAAWSAGAGSLAVYRKLLARQEKLRATRIAYDPPEAPAKEEEQWPAMYFAASDGVMCSDGANPTSTSAWVKAAERADKVAPGFGSAWTYTSSVCAGWQFRGVNAYRGSFNSKPAGGMLIMSTLHDPATPYHGARALRALVPNSRLVTVPAWGHGALDVSGCATTAREKYLVSGKLPSGDLSCRPDHRLFTPLD